MRVAIKCLSWQAAAALVATHGGERIGLVAVVPVPEDRQAFEDSLPPSPVNWLLEGVDAAEEVEAWLG